MTDNPATAIRIGTLVDAKGPDPASYIRQILPHGFESVALTFWVSRGDVDLRRLAARVRAELEPRGARVACVSAFGNPLGDTRDDAATRALWEALIDAAPLFGTDLVTGFAGRVRGRPIPESIPRFREVFGRLGRRAATRGVRLAFENCSMGGTWQTGDWNIAHNPAAWDLMFDAVPLDNLGLEWEPCHQMVALIEPLPQLRQWVKKVFHVHGKCATVLWDVVRTHGVAGAKPFAFHRTPGFGDCNWADIITELRRGGFRGSIDIEGWHDPVYRGDLEMTGQVHALHYLKRCRGGDFVPNPVVAAAGPAAAKKGRAASRKA
jgi:sugar phosphate isomerase/epimerase